MLGRVAERFNAPRQRRWQLSVDEKAQSRAPQDGVIVLASGEFEYCCDVFGFEIGIIGQDLFPRRTGRQKVEDVLHADAKAADAWAATAHARGHRDSVYRAHVLSTVRRGPDRAILALPVVQPATRSVDPDRFGLRSDAPSARRSRTLHGDSTAHALFHVFGERLHGFFGDFSPFTPCQRGFGLVHHGKDFEPSALALFPQRQGFLNRIFLAAKPRLNRPLSMAR